LQPDAVGSSEKLGWNLEGRETTGALCSRNSKIEKPTSIVCGPKANVSNVGFVFHEFSSSSQNFTGKSLVLKPEKNCAQLHDKWLCAL